VGFEGGQMPMHRRLPKRGFVSLTKADTAHVRLYELAGVGVDEIDILVLKQAGIVKASAKSAKVYLSGEIGKAVKLRGVAVTKGARAAIEAAGGTIAD
jgi:large subunit ribosomal protein L15